MSGSLGHMEQPLLISQLRLRLKFTHQQQDWLPQLFIEGLL